MIITIIDTVLRILGVLTVLVMIWSIAGITVNHKAIEYAIREVCKR